MSGDATRDDTTTVSAEDRARLLCVLRRASDPRWSFAYRGTRARSASDPPGAWTCMRVISAQGIGERGKPGT